jgi:WD40 repeat protein
MRSDAEGLLTEADLATSAQKVTELLMKLPDAQFDALMTSSKLPSNLKLTNEALNKAFLDTCRSVKQEVSQNRQQEKKRQLEAARAEARRQSVGRELVRLEGSHVKSGSGVTVSPDRNLIAFPIENTIHIWDIETRKEVAQLKPQSGLELRVTSAVTFSPDSRLLAALTEVDSRSRVTLWDVIQRRFVRDFEGTPSSDDGTEFIHGPIASTQRYIITNCSLIHHIRGVEKHLLKVFDITSGRCVHAFAKHKDSINCIAVSPDGKYAASGGDERIAILWDVESGEEIRVFDAHESALFCVAFSPDGRLLLTGGNDCTARLWEVSTGQQLHTWVLGPYSAEEERKMRLEDSMAKLEGRQPPIRIFKLNPAVYNLEFSPNGDRAIVGLYVFAPSVMKYSTNPVVLDVAKRTAIDLPATFEARPVKSVKAFFCRNGDAALFNKTREERIRGKDVEIEYYSLVGLP